MRVFYIAHAEHVPGVDEPPENVSFKPFERSRQLAWFEKVVLFSNIRLTSSSSTFLS
jgi:hypothetical protein